MHANRAFYPAMMMNVKMRLLQKLKDQAEIIICVIRAGY